MDLQAKSETFDRFKEFKALIENETGRHIRILRSDNGGEYESNEFDACYHQPCSCLCEVDPGWMIEGQATKEVEPRLPRLPNGWLSRQSRQPSLYVI